MIVLNRLRATRFKQLDEIDLRFPETGTVLIEGHNEAGKSSLFEAVAFALYGRPLINDRDYKIDNLKQYGAEDMEVILDFSVNKRAFTVTRRFGKRHSAKLVLPDESETITILSEIEKRLSEELRLSFDALLNTCFVEQKRLERLEDLNPTARQETINELLNLSSITRLQSEFKVGGEDRSTLDLQKSRVAIAALDDEWPKLQTRAETAHRFWLWAQWRDADVRADNWQSQIESGEETLQSLRQQREEIESNLRAAAELRGRLSTLGGELTLSARAWDEAQALLQQSESRVLELQKLQSELPAREELLQEYFSFAEQLEKLEEMEQEASVLQNRSERAQEELAERDAAQSAFDDDFKILEALEIQRDAARRELVAAEAALAARQTQQQRESSLRIWLIQLEKQRETAQRERELASRLQSARNASAQLENSQSRLEILQKAREIAAQLRQSEQEIADAQREVESAQRDLEREIARTRKRVALESERESAQEHLRASENLYAQAQTELRSVQLRAALENWLEAHSATNGEAQSTTPLAALAARETELQTALENAGRNVESSTSARMPGFAAMGAGVASLLAAFAFGFSSVAGIGAALLALVFFAIGALVLSNVARAKNAAQLEYSRLRREADSLKGERRALQMQTEQSALNVQREQRLRDETRGALESLGASVPDSAEAARAQLASLPQLPLETARQNFVERETVLHEARLQSGIASRALQDHGDDSAELQRREELSTCRKALVELETVRQAAHAQIEILARDIDEFDLRAALQNGDEGALQNSLDVARAALNSAQSAAVQVSEFESALQKLWETSESILREVLETARALSFESSENEEDFAERANTELAALRAARENLPDETLTQNVARARSTLGKLENRISVLEAQQKQRRAILDSLPRPQLIADLESARAAQSENEATLQTLLGVREELRARELPTSSAALRAALAAQHSSLQHAREEAAHSPMAQKNAADNREKYESAKQQFEEIWRRVFPDAKAPDDPAMADKALLVRAEQLQSELAVLDEGALQNRLVQLQDDLSECHQLLATLRHQLENACAEIDSLRRALQAETVSTAAEFLKSLEATSEGEDITQRSVAEWGTETQTRREAVAHNRSTRRVRADAIGQSEALLDFTQEQQSLREIEEAVAVKRRAGEIVETTRASIVRRVMPLTMQNIRRLLPLLTDNRYQDAEWDEGKNWILIYDAQARELVRKRTFSGGARDQISLALRLAFALATLPSEHNTRPGFLFLDEPLSSFDRARTQALVDLLTRGLIRQRFAQIFLVSHSESFDPALFDFRLRMEDGRVALSTLPT